MRHLLLASIVIAGCAGDELPDDYGELEARIDGAPPAEYATYHLNVADLSGRLLYDDSLALDEIVMPIDSRFVAALPAKQPLVVHVYATDESGIVVGAGTVVVVLPAKQTTKVPIQVLAKPGGQSGTGDITIGSAQLPDREFLAPQPATAKAGSTQSVKARLIDATSGEGVTEAFALQLDAAVAPMFLPKDGEITTTFSWGSAALFPLEASAKIAYVDAAGRGWVGLASTKFTGPDESAIVGVEWSGEIHASGTLAGGGRWIVGPADFPKVVGPVDVPGESSSGLAIYADKNNDGVFTDDEIFEQSITDGGRLEVFTTVTPVEIKMPPVVVASGAFVDLDADGSVDALVGLTTAGDVHVIPWQPGKTN